MPVIFVLGKQKLLSLHCPKKDLDVRFCSSIRWQYDPMPSVCIHFLITYGTKYFCEGLLYTAHSFFLFNFFFFFFLTMGDLKEEERKKMKKKACLILNCLVIVTLFKVPFMYI